MAELPVKLHSRSVDTVINVYIQGWIQDFCLKGALDSPFVSLWVNAFLVWHKMSAVSMVYQFPHQNCDKMINSEISASYHCRHICSTQN